MKSLEQVAKKMFCDYAQRQTGHYLDWRLLSGERKYAWIVEVADTYLECLKNLRQDLSLGKLPMSGAASYERGMVAGMAHEAHRLNERILVMEEEIKNQVEKFVLEEANKNVD